MGRSKLARKTKTYNLLMPLEDWIVLAKISFDESKRSGKQVSVAHLIREAYRAVYYEELE